MRTSGRSTSNRVAWGTSLDLDVRMVDTAAGPIEVAAGGSGPAVLLIHGIPGSWRQCVAIAEDLADAFTVVMPSRPGYGRTPIGTGRTYAEQADSFAALLDALGIEEAGALGISGGGPSAAALAERHPARTTTLVLACAMAPHLIARPWASRLLRVPGLPTLVGPPLRALRRSRIRRPETVQEQMRRGLSSDEYVRAEADERVRADLIRHELSHLEAPTGVAGLRNDLAQAALARASLQPSYPNLSCPVLLMYGGADKVIPLSHGDFYAAAIPHAERVTFDAAGHLFVLTRRSESSPLIRSAFEAAS